MTQPVEIAASPQVSAQMLQGKGGIPNNPKLPLLILEQVLKLPAGNPPEFIERLFADNHWTGSWRGSIYTYHHYHSTAHEVLAVYSGNASIQFGGPEGINRKLRSGDVVIIPAGVAHKNLGASSDFAVVGAYPEGQEWDLCYGAPGERPATDENIAKVPLPKSDPVFGATGPLLEHWTVSRLAV